VDPVQDRLILRKSGSAGNRTRTYGYVVNLDHNNLRFGRYPASGFFLLKNNVSETGLCLRPQPKTQLGPFGTHSPYLRIKSSFRNVSLIIKKMAKNIM
jgi:hypothetical protein